MLQRGRDTSPMTTPLPPHAFTPRKGRPRNPDITRRIVQVAQLFFARRGFDDVAMEEIARQADTTKSTIYFYFRSKQELFDAALDDLLLQLPPASDLMPPISIGESISEQLMVVAKRVNRLLSSMSFELVRRTLASNICTPLRERIWKAAGLPYFEAINDFLLVQGDRGALSLKDTRSAAKMFIALIAGGKALHSQLSGSSFGFIEEDHLHAAVELFIKGHSARPIT